MREKVTGRPGRLIDGSRFVAVVVGIVVLLSGCAVTKAAHAVDNAKNAIEGNKATIDGFTSTLKSGAPTTFEAVYKTTGSSPARVVYAVSPPHNLAFTDTATGTGAVSGDVVVNASGDYLCTPQQGKAPSCDKVNASAFATQAAILDFYTPSHWVDFLQEFALAAGFAGDKVTKSTLTMNGFAMKCVDFVTPGQAGTSTICTTAQGVLGYVKVAADATSFQITSFSTHPPASLFVLPAGAHVTVVTIPTTTATAPS